MKLNGLFTLALHMVIEGHVMKSLIKVALVSTTLFTVVSCSAHTKPASSAPVQIGTAVSLTQADDYKSLLEASRAVVDISKQIVADGSYGDRAALALHCDQFIKVVKEQRDFADSFEIAHPGFLLEQGFSQSDFSGDEGQAMMFCQHMAG